MKHPKNRTLLILAVLSIWLLALTACSGQAPSASNARSRAVINAGDIVPAEEIRVAEYLQYYDQTFPEPQHNSIGLDLRLGNSTMPMQGGLSWLQIGLQAKSDKTEIVAPLNLAIVIDRSGSMDSSDKMPYVKESLRIFLESLNPDDIVSLVTYSNDAELLLPAQPIGDGYWVERTIEQIEPDGNTNLHAGMMLGFQEVEKNFDIRRNNRVMLLTDGIANRGVTDADQIAADALAYNERDIYLSTIGLGLAFNDALLIELANQGRGGYTFVDSAAEMERVFREQVSSLKQRVASDVSLTVIPEPTVRLIGLTGLDSQPPDSGATIPMWSLGTGDSSVMLAQLQVGQANQAGAYPIATVQLSYFDEFAQQTINQEQTISVEMSGSVTAYDPTWDLEILRNVTIQRTAEGMQEIDRLFQTEQYESAWRKAVELERQLTEVARLTDDPQMFDDSALMQRYQQTLADALWQVERRAPRLDDAAPTEENDRPYRQPSTPAMPTVVIE